MFTGIIEEKGTVERITSGERSMRLTIGINKIAKDLKLGDSVAVNGVCLTAAEIGAGSFTADVMAETVRRTSLSRLVPGSRVNLERAMAMGGRFGGHIVSGHVDGTGTIISMTREDNAIWIRIAADEKLMRYIVEKGSVALDGISLTVAEVGRGEFSVSVIPHTAAETTLAKKSVGDIINIECDIIGKYVEKLTAPQSGGITEEFLKQYGF
ncbi:MAG: riboflavin synthase [Clostridia bacterium]|nr:riboflavin synthase [Clostridia bacterium]